MNLALLLRNIRIMKLACPPKTNPRNKLGLAQKGGSKNAKKAVHIRTDHQQASGSRGAFEPETDRDRGGEKAGNQRTDLLSLAQGIWGLGTTQARKLKELEKENMQLKKLVADLSLDNAILKEVLSKK